MTGTLRNAIIVCLILLVAGAQAGLGTEVRSGTLVSVPSGTTVPDDLMAFGQDISVGGKVSGDLLAFGSQVSSEGNIAQDAVVAAGTVNIGGRVGDDLRAAGGTVNVVGVIGDNASVAGGTITMANTSSIGRDLQVAGGNVAINGAVRRNLQVAGGDVTINGTIGGDVRANADQLALGPGAVIRGNLTYTSGKKVNISPGARVAGNIVFKPRPAKERRAPGIAGSVAFWLITFFALYLVGVLLVALAPRMAVEIADRISGAAGVSLLVGLILLVVVPIVAVFMMVTVIGIPLAFILLFAYAVMIYISRIYVGLAIGRWIFGRAGRTETSPYLNLLIGLLIIWLVGAMPVVGWLVNFVAIIIGLGALAYHRYDLTCGLRREGRL
jgi:cytoskeletal protein CcmA (bactofilin family)